MTEWVKAGYRVSSMQPRAIVTTLKHVFKIGSYNLYECHNGTLINVFDNQKELLKFVEDNIGSVFNLGFIKEDYTIYGYHVEIGDHTEFALTLARASVAVQGSTELPRKLHITPDDEIIIE